MKDNKSILIEFVLDYFNNVIALSLVFFYLVMYNPFKSNKGLPKL